MRLNSKFNVLTFLTVSLIFSTPLLVLAQCGASPEELQRRAASQKQEGQVHPQTETTLQLSVRDQARQDAHKDVNTYVNRPMWFIIGCIFPAVGLLAPISINPLSLKDVKRFYANEMEHHGFGRKTFRKEDTA